MKRFRHATNRHGFLKSGKGAIALFSGILAIPVIGVGLLSFEAINHYQVDVRLDRATANSTIFGGKQDYGGGASLTPEQQAFLETLLRINMQGMIEDSTLVTANPTLDSQNGFWFEMDSTYPYSAIYALLLNAGITRVATGIGDSAGGGQYRVERRRIPIEYVLVLDASSSMSGDPLAKIKGGLERFLENAFGQDGADPDNDPNVRVSMVEFSENVNVGARYRDELITKKSQKVPGKKSKRQAGYLVSKAFGYKNYLSKKGPEASRGGACVARKSDRNGLIPMESGNKLSPRYAKLLENPPKSEADKFDLLISEGSYSGFKPGLGGSPDSWEIDLGVKVMEMCTDFVGSPGEPGFLAYHPGTAEIVNTAAGKTVLAIQHLPWEERPDCLKKGIRKVGAPWFKKYIWPGIRRDLAVSAYPGCAQPILIASNSKSELETYLDGYVGVWTTAADEGFAWGYRALHPNWRSVWNSDHSRKINSPGVPVPVPADFNAGVKKKFILFSDGFNNQRFFDISGAQGEEENVRRFCEYLTGVSPSSPRQLGDIEVSVALTGGQSNKTVAYLRNCASLPKEKHFLKSASVDKIAEFLAGLGHPEYEIRFVKKPSSS